MTRTRALAVACLLALLCAVPARGEQPVNVDELPHLEIALPNGTKVKVIRYQEHNWRVVDVSVLWGTNAEDSDICFEGKFDMLVQPDKIKLLGHPVVPGTKDKQWATIICDDRLMRRPRDRNDNLWFCGTLRKSGPNTLELAAVDVLKLPPDVQRFEQNIERLNKLRDADQLIDLGQTIKEQGRKDIRIEDQDKLNRLSRTAYEYGLALKE